MSSPGKLIPTIIRGQKFPNFRTCDTCQTIFPILRYGVAWCNGQVINRCPWCRPDSRPWKAGRGK